MLEYLLDDDIQKRVVDNKYGTPNSTNTDKSVIEKTGRFSSIKKFFGFGLDIKEA
jgi:hypothetical protein